MRTNVISSVAMSVVDSPHSYDAYWWWLVVEGADVVGAAFRTAPFGLQTGPMPLEAAALLAEAVSAADPGIPFLVGTEAFVDAFLATYTHLTKRGATRGRSNHLYELDALRIPDTDGEFRHVTLDDVELVAQWFDDFHYFIEGTTREPDERDRAAVRDRVASDSVRFWCVDNVAVAMAGHARPVATPVGTVTRVGPVFTPAENRRRGYGAAVTAHLSAELVRDGARVMLYTDADNPTSNSIYQAIGYRFLEATAQYDLSDPT